MKKLFLSCLAAMIAFASCSNDGFTCTFTKADVSYTADIVHSTGTDTHTMKLNSGDVLTVHHETKSGDMRLTITAGNGMELYSGDGKTVHEFTLIMPTDGSCTVTLGAQNATGSVCIKKGE